MVRAFRTLTAFLCILGLAALALAAEPSTTSAPAASAPTPDPLVRVLLSKGILTAEEASTLASGSAAERQDRLAKLLQEKGVLSAAEYASLSNSNERLVGLPVTSPAALKPAVLREPAVALPATVASAPAPTSAPAITPPIIAAIAPIRALQLEPAKQGGLVPDLKLGSGAKLKIYGFFKATTIYDTSSPLGTDMPLPGFLGDTGPNAAPEFHVKARALRLGANFEWPDLSKKVALTGKLETDFEGNFTRVLNRNISTVRSSQPSIRLAWARLDYNFNDKNGVFGLFGQDWTPFGSSTLPNLLETTGLGLGFGTLYERAPQARFGYYHLVGGSRAVKISPEIAVVLPAYGNTPTDVGSQLGMGERQGADSGRPEIEGRLVTQFQLDQSKGVLPAQLIFSFVQGSRAAILRAQDIPTAFKATFPDGARLETNRFGYTVETQLPTRWFTLLTKFWTGEDLRFFFVGNLLSNFNDTTGLTGTTTASTMDGSSSVVFGYRNGVPVIAPQKPVRDIGGFVNLGIPLSRLASANPEGRNSGWTLYLHYAFDNAYASDVRHLPITSASGPCAPNTTCSRPNKNDLGAATLFYKLNNWVSFGWEESYYRTRATGGAASWPLFAGKPGRSWHDFRSEVGPVFTF